MLTVTSQHRGRARKPRTNGAINFKNRDTVVGGTVVETCGSAIERGSPQNHAWKRQRDVLFEVTVVRAVRGWGYNITGINARENPRSSVGQMVARIQNTCDLSRHRARPSIQ